MYKCTKVLITMCKCTNNLETAYLCNLFAPRTSTYDFRDAKGKLLLPKPRTDYLKRSVSYSGALVWKTDLPEEVRTATSLDLFMRSTHTWLSEQYSHMANLQTSCREFLFIFYVMLVFLTVYK